MQPGTLFCPQSCHRAVTSQRPCIYLTWEGTVSSLYPQYPEERLAGELVSACSVKEQKHWERHARLLLCRKQHEV